MLDKLLTQCQKKIKYPAKLGNFPVFKQSSRHDNILLPLGTNYFLCLHFACNLQLNTISAF